MAPIDDSVARNLETAAATPISHLRPDLADQDSRVVRGEITITWPYNSVKRSLAFLLSESDIRLRRSRGQVRVQLNGSGAQAVSSCNLGSGDEVVLSLLGVEWAVDDSAQQLPGSRVEWQLKYAGKLLLQVKNCLSDEITVININNPVDAEAPAAVADAHLEPIASEPEPLPIQAPTYYQAQRLEADEFASPAFIRRAKVSYGSFFEGSFDDILEEDGGMRGRGRKKLRFGRDSGAWRYNSTSRSPTPSDQDEQLEQNVAAAEPQDEARINLSFTSSFNLPPVLVAENSTGDHLPVTSSPMPPLPNNLQNGGPAEPPIVHHEAPPQTLRPQMTDEGCQTSDLLASPEPTELPSAIIGGQISDLPIPAPSDLQPEQEHVLSSTSIPTQEAPPIDGLTKSSPPFGSSLFGSYAPSTTQGFTAAPFPTATSALGFDPEVSLGDQVRFGFAEPQDSLAFTPATAVQVSQPVPDPSSHYPNAYLDQSADETQLDTAADATQPQLGPDDQILVAEPPPPPHPNVNGSASLDQVTVWPITTRTLDAEHAEGQIPLASAVGTSLQEADEVRSGSDLRTDIPREVDDYGHNERRYQNEAEEEMVGMDDAGGDNGYDPSGWESDAEAEYDEAEANTAGDDYDMRAYADVDDDEEGFEYATGEAGDYGEGEVFDDDDGEGSYDEEEDNEDEEEYDSEYGDEVEPQPMPQPARQPAPARSGPPVVIDLISDSEDESEVEEAPEMIRSNAVPITSTFAVPSSSAPTVSTATEVHSREIIRTSQTQVVDFGNMDGREQRVLESTEADREDASPSYEVPADGSEEDDDESGQESDDDEMEEDVEPEDQGMIDVEAQSSADEAEGSAADADGELYDDDIMPPPDEQSEPDQAPEDSDEGSDVEVVLQHTKITVEVDTKIVETQLVSDATEQATHDTPNVEMEDGSVAQEASVVPGSPIADHVASSPANDSAPQTTTTDTQVDSKSQDASGEGVVGVSPSSPPLTQSFESQVPMEQEIIVSSSPIASQEQRENTDQLLTPYDTQPDGPMLSQQAILDSMEGEQTNGADEVPSPEQPQVDVDEAEGEEDKIESDAETESAAVQEPGEGEKADEVVAEIHVATPEKEPDDTEPPPTVSQNDDHQVVEDTVEATATNEPTEMELDEATQESAEQEPQEDGPEPSDDQGIEVKDEASVNEVDLIVPASQVSEQVSEVDGAGGASGEDAPKSKKKRGRKKKDDASSTKASTKAPAADLSVELARASRRSTRQQKPETPKKGAVHTRTRSFQKTPTPEAPDSSFELAKAALQSPSKTVASLKTELGKRLRTDLPTYVNLQNLSYHIGKRLDVIAIATSDSTRPERTKTRQFALSVNLTDPTTAPSRVVEAQFYRAHKESLPVIKAGDSVLLRGFEVVSMTNKGFGLRTHEESGYAVVEQENDKVQINGPPVEDIETETEYVVTLKQWYKLLDSATKAKLRQANQKLVDATPPKKK